MRKIARGLGLVDVKLNLILTSPYLRARETTDILADAFRLIDNKIIETENLTPEGDASQLVEEINTNYAGVENIALVGHEPYLSDLVSVLLSGSSALDLDFKKGGVCHLVVENLRYNKCATLEWFLTPSQLATID